MDQLSEQEIVQGLREGNRAAWDQLCQRYGPRVWQFLARLLGRDPQLVADLYQDTLLAVARSGRNLAVESKLWPWLSTIAHNQVALHWRKQYRRQRDIQAESNGDVVDPAPYSDPTSALERLESVQSVRRLMAEMPAEHVAVLTAKYLDELSVADMVTLLGGTVESVRSRLARARRDFRARYEQCETERGLPTKTKPDCDR